MYSTSAIGWQQNGSAKALNAMNIGRRSCRNRRRFWLHRSSRHQVRLRLHADGSGQQGNTWMMLLARAQSYCPLVCCWTRHGAASPSRQM